METNKFYTPELNEFSVGFEFQMHSTITQSFCRVATAEWTTVHLHETDFLITLLHAIKSEKIRVKHLDQEDIESLGLKLWQIPGDSFDWEFNINDSEGNCIGSVTFDNGMVAEIELFGRTFNIKNKNELKKLMVQLNIL